jgi:hypothetical protein
LVAGLIGWLVDQFIFNFKQLVDCMASCEVISFLPLSSSGTQHRIHTHTLTEKKNKLISIHVVELPRYPHTFFITQHIFFSSNEKKERIRTAPIDIKANNKH